MEFLLNEQENKSVKGFLLGENPFCFFNSKGRKIILFHGTSNGYVSFNENIILAKDFFKYLYDENIVVDTDDIYYICCYSSLVSTGRIKRGLSYKPLIYSKDTIKAVLQANKLMIINN